MPSSIYNSIFTLSTFLLHYAVDQLTMRFLYICLILLLFSSHFDLIFDSGGEGRGFRRRHSVTFIHLDTFARLWSPCNLNLQILDRVAHKGRDCKDDRKLLTYDDIKFKLSLALILLF